MTLSARDVAAVLRDRLPGLPTKKLHKLLYYCQGHHLAAFDEPLFSETISAWDMGPVVGNLWYAEKQGDVPRVHREMNEAQLNTVGYVLSRYGALTGQDLENLTHSEEPWQLADSGRRPGESAHIKPEWIKQYFRTSGSADDEKDDVLLDSASVMQWLQGAEKRREDPVRPDKREELVARLEELRARLPSRV
ncbi:MAG: SocA family protein [Pseudonocardiales bacterium]|nr:SocA family protein [Pseudonocardiales bacterium]MBV9730213.1 SocA family protein [Pseudonocardiales bacterium]